jgi:hypothetical protein
MIGAKRRDDEFQPGICAGKMNTPSRAVSGLQPGACRGFVVFTGVFVQVA